jgi:beta-glucosidase
MIILKLIVIGLAFIACESVDLEKLLDSMSYADKCGQMTHLDSGMLLKPANGPTNNLYPTESDISLDAIRDIRVGSFFDTPFSASSGEQMQRFVNLIQTIVQNVTDLKIPILFAVDSIHGAGLFNKSVIFPTPLAQASTFNVDYSRRIGSTTAMETRANGVPWNFSPILGMKE